MEYRYRRRTAYFARQGDAKPAYWLAAGLFLAVAGLIAFSGPSTWVAKTVLAPAFATGADNPAVQASARREDDVPASETVENPAETRSAALPAYTCYALQIGIYEDEANAREQALSLMALGAAGRIVEDGGRYRVLASGYPEQADAKAVQTQLAAEGIDSYLYPVRCAERTYTISGDAAALQTALTAIAGVEETLSGLYEEMLSLDAESRTAEEGKNAARTAADDCRAEREALMRLPQDAGGELAALAEFYASVAQAAEDVANAPETEKAAISARWKALYLSAVYVRSALSR